MLASPLTSGTITSRGAVFGGLSTTPIHPYTCILLSPLTCGPTYDGKVLVGYQKLMRVLGIKRLSPSEPPIQTAGTNRSTTALLAYVT
jgi:hypothetical protein